MLTGFTFDCDNLKFSVDHQEDKPKARNDFLDSMKGSQD